MAKKRGEERKEEREKEREVAATLAKPTDTPVVRMFKKIFETGKVTFSKGTEKIRTVQAWGKGVRFHWESNEEWHPENRIGLMDYVENGGLDHVPIMPEKARRRKSWI